MRQKLHYKKSADFSADRRNLERKSIVKTLENWSTNKIAKKFSSKLLMRSFSLI